MTLEEKKRVLSNIRRYRERKRLASQALISAASSAIPVPASVLISAGS
jgi:hypothetical protein